MTKTQENLLFLIRKELEMTDRTKERKPLSFSIEESEWRSVLAEAKADGIVGFLWPTVKQISTGVPSDVSTEFKIAAEKSAKNSYRLWSFCYEVVNILEKEGFHLVVIKGPAAAKYFPVPEYRKSGDVDLCVPTSEYKDAERVLLDKGFKKVNDTALHGELTWGGLTVELHRLMVEPLPDEKANKTLEKLYLSGVESRVNFKIDEKIELFGYNEVYNGFELMLHMLQHFIVGGFGIKLLCDWTAYLLQKHPDDIIEQLIGIIKEMKLTVFAATVTFICIQILGLPEEIAKPFINDESREELQSKADSLVGDILNAGECENEAPEYMVVLNDNSIGSLIKQFHYQMKCNHPKASKCVLLWPFLWVITLVVFLYNNRFKRHVKTFDVIKGTRERAKNVGTDSLELFKK